MLYHFGFFAFHTFIFVGIFYVSSVFGLYVFVQVSLRLSLLLRLRLRGALSGITGYYPSHAAWRRAVLPETCQAHVFAFIPVSLGRGLPSHTGLPTHIT